MIIPIRCFTCGTVIAGKWEAYVRGERALADREAGSGESVSKSTAWRDRVAGATENDARKAEREDPRTRGELLDSLGVRRICCRRHFLGNVDLMDEI